MSPSGTPANQYNILVVDDNKDDHFFINKAIQQVIPNATVTALFDGSEAVEYLFSSSHLPDLILLDLHMSKISGSFTLNLLKKSKRHSQIPVVILTSSNSLADRLDLKIKLRANAFYTKPFGNDALEKIIQEIKEDWLLGKKKKIKTPP